MYGAKKLVVVLATSLSVTVASIEDILWLLEKVLCIHYLLRFQKDLRETRALINSGSEINAMTPAYIAKLGLEVQKTDIKA